MREGGPIRCPCRDVLGRARLFPRQLSVRFQDGGEGQLIGALRAQATQQAADQAHHGKLTLLFFDS